MAGNVLLKTVLVISRQNVSVLHRHYRKSYDTWRWWLGTCCWRQYLSSADRTCLCYRSENFEFFPLRPKINLWVVHVGFMVDRVPMGQVLQYFSFRLLTVVPPAFHFLIHHPKLVQKRVLRPVPMDPASPRTKFEQRTNRKTSGTKRIRLTSVEICLRGNNTVFWNVTPCGSCNKRRFERMYRLHHQGDKRRRDEQR
jgi:hypothetical protein